MTQWNQSLPKVAFELLYLNSVMPELPPPQYLTDQLTLLAYLGAYGTHMFALRVWVGDGTSKTFFSCSITLKMLS